MFIVTFLLLWEGLRAVTSAFPKKISFSVCTNSPRQQFPTYRGVLFFQRIWFLSVLFQFKLWLGVNARPTCINICAVSERPKAADRILALTPPPSSLSPCLPRFSTSQTENSNAWFEGVYLLPLLRKVLTLPDGPETDLLQYLDRLVITSVNSLPISSLKGKTKTVPVIFF